MLGRLRMSVDDCIRVYTGLSDRVFRKFQSRFALPSLKFQARFDTEALERAIQEIVEGAGHQVDTLLYDPDADGPESVQPKM
jgi:hypothetical protein